MTEAQWLAWKDPRSMLESIRNKASDRKLRLCLGACCRRVLEPTGGQRRWQVLTAMEGFADGVVSPQAVQDAIREDLPEEYDNRTLVGYDPIWHFDVTSLLSALTNPDSITPVDVVTRSWRLATDTPVAAIAMAGLVRDVFNPFRRVIIDPGWLTSNVNDLARTIYEEKAFERLPILADALMDAGCANEQLLNHLRSPGPHVRGCWALDLILSKE